MPFRVLSAFVTVLILAGCASLPTPRSEAIHYALTTDATLRELANECARMSPELRTLAVQAQRDWWRRNGNIVAAADYGLLQLNWDDARQPVEDQRAYLSMQILEMVQDNADTQVAEWTEGKKAGEECEDQLVRYRDGKADLSREKKYFETLVALQNEKERLTTDVDQARVINAHYRKYGRSLFVVEQKVQVLGCDRPQISMLRNAWPLEVYDAVCSDQSYLLIQCEWGRCDVRQ